MNQFYAEIGVNDTHHRHNRMPLEELDKTIIKGSNPINSIVASEGMIEYVERHKLLDHNEITCSDYWAYTIDINL